MMYEGGVVRGVSQIIFLKQRKEAFIMKKRIALMATALLCALAICLSVIPALTIFAEGAEPENIALGKTVTVTDGGSIENEQNGIAALTDGRFGWYANQAGGQRGWIKDFGFIPSEENPLDIVIDLDGLYEISAFTIHPTTSYNSCFPTYFEIQVSATEDGDDWVTVHSDEDVDLNGRLSSSAPIENYNPDNKYDVALDETETACRVRIHITEPSNCWDGDTTNYMGFGEIEVYGVAAATETEPAPELDNVALNAYADQNNNNFFTGWEAMLLTDGNTESSWHGDYLNFAGSSLANPTILTVYFGNTCLISTVNVYSYTGEVYVAGACPEGAPVLPRAFTVEVFSVEEDAWIEVGAYDLDAWALDVPDPDVLTYTFDAVEATMVRMVITEDGGYAEDVFPSGVTVVGELEVLGTVVGAIPPAETEAPEVTETETQAPSVTETEAPEETVVETVVESDVESAEESAEESDTTAETVVDETVADTGVEETVAETTAATDAPAADADKGCASVVGFGAVAVLTAAAAAVVLKKKD